MQIDKMIVIGGVCEGFRFADIFNKRVKGPVDNVVSNNFSATLDLFNGKLFNDILNDNITRTCVNPNLQNQLNEQFIKFHDDEYIRYYGNWHSGHINFTLPKRKDSFKERIINFNNFCEETKVNSNYYFIYSISEEEYELSKNMFDNTINTLPQYVVDKLIIIGGVRNPIPNIFYDNFRCISFNMDLSFQNKTFVKLWEY